MANDINLAALWVPVLPETSQIAPAMRKAGEQAKKEFVQGFSPGASGSDSPEALGQKYAQQFSRSFNSTFEGLPMPKAMKEFMSSLGNETKLTENQLERLKSTASKTFGEYEQSLKTVAHYQSELTRITEMYNRQVAEGGMKGKGFVWEQQQKALQAYNFAVQDATEKQKAYNAQVSKLDEATAGSAKGTQLLSAAIGGLAGAAATLGIQAIETGFEKITELAKEAAKFVLESGETIHDMGIQVTKFTDASGEDLEHLKHLSEEVFTHLDVSGENLGQTMAVLQGRFKLTDDELKTLATHVTELHGRFQQFDPTTFTQVLGAFGVEGKNADEVLASFLKSARESHTDLGKMVNDLSSVTDTLSISGLSVEQAGYFMAQVSTHVKSASTAVGTLQRVEAEGKKEGIGFQEAMRLTVQRMNEMRAAGDEAGLQQLSETLFGSRRWADALAVLNDFNDALGKTPEQLASTGAAVDQFDQQTQGLKEKWQLLKNNMIAVFAPLGEEILTVLGNVFGKMKTAIDQHKPEIGAKIKELSHKFIEALPDILDFAAASVQALGRFADFTKEMIVGVMEAAGALQKGWGLLTGSDETKKAGEDLYEAGVKLGKINFGEQGDAAAKWIKGLKDDLPGLTTGVNDLSSAISGIPGDTNANVNVNVTGSGTLPNVGAPGAIPGLPGSVPPGTNTGTGAVPPPGPLNPNAPGAVTNTNQPGAHLLPEGYPTPQGGKPPPAGKYPAGKIWDYVEGKFVDLPAGQQPSTLPGTNIPNPLGPGSPTSSGPIPGDVLSNLPHAPEPAPSAPSPPRPSVGSVMGSNPLLFIPVIGTWLSWLGGGFPGESRPNASASTDQSGNTYNIAPAAVSTPIDATGANLTPAERSARNKSLAQQYFTSYFPAGEWSAFEALTNSESGFDNLSQNPSSTAHGIGQFLNTTWATLGSTFTDNPAIQLDLMFRYIMMRYGTPTAAWAFKQANNWYKEGGTIPYSSGAPHSGGPKGKDTVAIWAEPGEEVIAAEPAAKHRALLKAINGQSGYGGMYFDTGGTVPYSPSIGVGANTDIRQNAPGFPPWVYQLAAQFGTPASTYPGHQDGFGIDWGFGVPPANKEALARYFLSLGTMPQVIWKNPETGYRIGVHNGQPVGPDLPGSVDKGYYRDDWAGHTDHVHTRFPPASYVNQGMGQAVTTSVRGGQPGVSWNYDSSGAYGPSTPGQFPGLPGQYGGYGTYGGLTYDQMRQDQKAVDNARQRLSDMDYAIQQQKDQIEADRKALDKLKSEVYPLTGKRIATDEQVLAAEQKLAQSTHELEVKQRERGDQVDNISDAERKQAEDLLKPPTERKGGAGKDYTSMASQLGSGLMKGIAQEFGLGEVFAKPPWEWGIVKLGAALANWGIGTANSWADVIGQGGTGLTGFQPIPGWQNKSGPGLNIAGVNTGINLNPSNTIAGRQPTNVSNAPNVQVNPATTTHGTGLGQAPGPVTVDNSVNVTNNGPNQSDYDTWKQGANSQRGNTTVNSMGG